MYLISGTLFYIFGLVTVLVTSFLQDRSEVFSLVLFVFVALIAFSLGSMFYYFHHLKEKNTLR